MRIPLAVLVVLLPASAAADFCPEPVGDNESIAGGTAAPSASVAVRMVGETVDLTELRNDLSPHRAPLEENVGWKVQARYVFENTVNREIRTTMIFPWAVPMSGGAYERVPLTPEQLAEEAAMRAAGEEGEVCSELRWTAEGIRFEREEIETYGVVIRVDGTPVTTELKQDVTCGKDLTYLFGHTFPMTFAPRATVNVDIEYTQPASSGIPTPWTRHADCGYFGVNFVLRSGAPWKGPIGEVVMRYHLAYPTRMLELTSRMEELLEHSTDDMKIAEPFRNHAIDFTRPPLQADLVCENNVSTLTLTGHDVEPTGDVYLRVDSQFQRAKVLRWQGCPLDPTDFRPTRNCCAEVNGPLVEPPISEMQTNLPAGYLDDDRNRQEEAAAFLCLRPGYAGDEPPVRPPAEDVGDGADASADAEDEPASGLESTMPAAGEASATTADAGSPTQAPPPQQKKGCGCAVASSPAEGLGSIALVLVVGLVRSVRRRAVCPYL